MDNRPVWLQSVVFLFSLAGIGAFTVEFRVQACLSQGVHCSNSVFSCWSSSSTNLRRHSFLQVRLAHRRKLITHCSARRLGFRFHQGCKHRFGGLLRLFCFEALKVHCQQSLRIDHSQPSVSTAPLRRVILLQVASVVSKQLKRVCKFFLACEKLRSWHWREIVHFVP